VKSRAVEWTAPLESALAAPMTVTDDTLYFTTRDPSASSTRTELISSALDQDA
jgi:hypothetical protein